MELTQNDTVSTIDIPSTKIENSCKHRQHGIQTIARVYIGPFKRTTPISIQSNRYYSILRDLLAW